MFSLKNIADGKKQFGCLSPRQPARSGSASVCQCTDAVSAQGFVGLGEKYFFNMEMYVSF